MQNVDTFLSDMLHSRERTVTDIKVGTGISKTGFSWPQHARRQAARVRPHAVIVFLGANEGASMRTSTGMVECCAEPWTTEYSRRVRDMMRAYSRQGRGRVVWLTLPAPRKKGLREIYAAVNSAIRAAAQDVAGVYVLPLDNVLTPGFRYRATVTIGGRRRPIHEADGIHLSLPAAELAARLAARALVRP
jgi:hypothetical protein